MDYPEWIFNSSRRMMFGMHFPDYDQIPESEEFNIEILSRFDPQRIVHNLKKAEVQAFWFYGKCHMGNAYYHSKVGHVHSAMKGRDFVGELSEECLKAGIVPLAVYEVSDRRMPVDKPEWCHKAPAQAIAADTDLTDALEGASIGGACINGPYGDFVIEQAKEIVSNYPVKGIFFDFLGLFTFGRWICPYCGEKFKKKFGFDFRGEQNLSHKEYVDYVRWHYGQNDSYAKKLCRAIKDIRPDVIFTHNFHGNSHKVNMQRANFTAENCDFVAGDLFTHRSGMLQLSWKIRQYANLSGKAPGEVLLDLPSCIKGDFSTVKALDSYRAESWTAWALNTAVCCGLTPRIDGIVSEKLLGMAEKVFSEQKSYAPWLKQLDMIAEIGIVHSHDANEFAPVPANSQVKGSHHGMDFEGWCQILIAGHFLWDIISQHQISYEHLLKYKLVILPNVSCLSNQECKAIESYVENGGTIIADGDTSFFDQNGNARVNFALADVFGADTAGVLNEKYLQLELDAEDYKFNCPWREDLIFFNDGQMDIDRHKDAVSIGSVYSKTKHAIINAMLPVNKSGLLKNQYGEGKAYYFAGKPGLQYRVFGQNSTKELAVKLLDKAVADRLLEIQAVDTVELIANRNGNGDLVVHLINAVSGGGRFAGNASWQAKNVEDCLTRFGEYEKMPPAGDVTVKLNLNGKTVKRIYIVPENKELHFKPVCPELIEFKIKNLHVHKMFVVEYYKTKT